MLTQIYYTSLLDVKKKTVNTIVHLNHNNEQITY